MRGPVEKQGQKQLEASRGLTCADIAIYGLFRQIAGEAQTIAAAEFAHRIRIQRCFTGRQQLYPVQFIARALGVGIEMTDGLDVTVQQVDTVRTVRTHGEYIEQRTTYRKFAMRD